MKNYIVIILFFAPLFLFGNSYSLDSLDFYLSKKSEYDSQKEGRINQIKLDFQKEKDPEKLYTLCDDLFHEYSSYMYDSAYVYGEKLMEISYTLNDHDKITSSTIKKGFGYLSSGLFKECFDLFSSIDISNCCDETKIDYYHTKARLYYDIADYNNHDEFILNYHAAGNEIIDSVIALLQVDSPRFWSSIALKRMKSDNIRGAIDAFQKMISSGNYSEHDYAIATSSLAYLFTLQEKTDEAKQYLIRAAIADIKSSTKETVALRNLAQVLYNEGDISRAVSYIRHALEDAYFYNARHRQLEIGHILPIIEKERMNIIEKQKDRITNYSLFISVLLIILLGAFFIIWKQLHDLNRAKKEIQKVNENLTEADKIKEEYIGYFFSLNSEFIEKMEAFQKYVKKKALEKKYEDLATIPKNFNVQKEREALYTRFDQIFLKIFPDFVEKFNDLLKPEERIELKKDELLNADLRIYALIRLGINDNEKIAKFLDYSVNTIYTYKTKIKNKAKYPTDEFKKRLMDIKSI